MSRSISPVIIHETMRGRIIILSILMSISPGKAISRMASLEGSAARSAMPRIIPIKTPPMVRTSNKFSLPQEWHCRNKIWTIIASIKIIMGSKVGLQQMSWLLDSMYTSRKLNRIIQSKVSDTKSYKMTKDCDSCIIILVHKRNLSPGFEPRTSYSQVRWSNWMSYDRKYF